MEHNCKDVVLETFLEAPFRSRIQMSFMALSWF